MKGVTVLENTSVRDGRIDLELSDSDILQRVQSGQAFVAKGVFPEAGLRQAYVEVFEAFLSEKPGVWPIEWGAPDFLRIDDNPPASAIPKCQSIYFLFAWNSRFPRIQRVAKLLHDLRNRIARLDTEFGCRRDDDHYLVPVLQHYPEGGGFMAKHQDPVEPQKCVVSLAMSTAGKDHSGGGLYVERDGRDVEVEQMIQAGDLFIFPPDLPHGVAPLDGAATEVDFQSPAGRWRLASVLTPAQPAPG